jgi:hypothetical protein
MAIATLSEQTERLRFRVTHRAPKGEGELTSRWNETCRLRLA